MNAQEHREAAEALLVEAAKLNSAAATHVGETASAYRQQSANLLAAANVHVRLAELAGVL